jgi:D-alanine-D-alanine ligase
MRVGLLANIKPSGEALETLTAQLSAKVANVDDLFAEWDAIETVEAVRSALASHPGVECEIIEAIPEKALPKLQSEEYDIIFNIAEGFLGNAREAQFPALLEMLGIPYTGSGPLALAIALDKARTKEILSYHGIPVSRFVTLHKPVATLEQALPGSRYPVVVKPLAEGSSKGVKNSSFVRSDRELTQEIIRIREDYQQAAIVEEFLPGREFTVAVLGNSPNAQVLPIVEINFAELPTEANKIYSYEAKWIYDVAENPLDIFACPAELEPYTRKEIESVVLAAYETLDCRDWSRVDIRMDARGRANVIEINPLPGILPKPEENSCFPKAARAAGLSYEEMLLSVLKAGCDRYSIPFQFASSLTH